jgi:hypothetical protein
MVICRAGGGSWRSLEEAPDDSWRRRIMEVLEEVPSDRWRRRIVEVTGGGSW